MGKLWVVRSRQRLIRPCEKTPSTTLELSGMDKVPVLRCNARTLHVYRESGATAPASASSVIAEAVSKALVPYYPLAGRLTNDLSHIDCCGEGVGFVEASSESFLDELDLEYVQDDLLPKPNSNAANLVQMQVTQFACGGFIIGLIFSHTICDGLGAAQFLNAVGEFARGLQSLTVQPLWCRDFFPSNTNTNTNTNTDADTNTTTTTTTNHLPFPSPVTYRRLEQANVDISMDQIDKLKQQFQRQSQRCSTFEVVAAIFWSCRTKAILMDIEDEDVKFVFFANCRQLLEPPLPKGFYGNCFFPATITARGHWVAGASLLELIKLIQQAKAKVSQEFHDYRNRIINNTNQDGDDPFLAPPSYKTLFLSEWGRLGFNQVDFGWGPPERVVPIQGSPIIPAGILILGWQPANTGIRLMTWCVEEPRRHLFLHHITQLFISSDQATST